jgi:hypothetical protein
MQLNISLLTPCHGLKKKSQIQLETILNWIIKYIFMSIYQSSIYLSIYLSFYLSIYLAREANDRPWGKFNIYIYIRKEVWNEFLKLLVEETRK